MTDSPASKVNPVIARRARRADVELDDFSILRP